MHESWNCLGIRSVVRVVGKFMHYCDWHFLRRLGFLHHSVMSGPDRSSLYRIDLLSVREPHCDTLLTILGETEQDRGETRQVCGETDKLGGSLTSKGGN